MGTHLARIGDFFSQQTDGRGHFGELDVDRRITLK
jgi:hypothetical protein